MFYRKTALALAAVTAIAAPAAAAKPGNGNGQGQGDGHGPRKGVSYVFKGTYSGAGVVAVSKGNAHVRKAELVGTEVAFDLATAKLTVADTNADGVVTADDVVAGDKVVVKAKLPKGDPGAAPYPARKLVDQTNAPQETPEA